MAAVRPSRQVNKSMRLGLSPGDDVCVYMMTCATATVLHININVREFMNHPETCAFAHGTLMRHLDGESLAS